MGRLTPLQVKLIRRERVAWLRRAGWDVWDATGTGEVTRGGPSTAVTIAEAAHIEWPPDGLPPSLVWRDHDLNPLTRLTERTFARTCVRTHPAAPNP